MDFNFKEALESLDYSHIIESKAEEFLKETINKLKDANIAFTDIDELYFSICIETYIGRDYIGYRLSSLYKPNAENDMRKFKSIYEKDHFSTYKEAHDILEAIETKLKNEGFECKDTTNLYEVDWELKKIIKVKI